MEAISLPIAHLILFLLAGSARTALTSVDSPEPSPWPPANSPATSLYVLGDSSVSWSNNSILFPLLPHQLSIPCAGSSRRHFPDFIAEKMGLPPPTPFYSGNWTLASLSSGINFGSTPATILSYSSPISAAAGMFLFQTLSQQVRQVYETLQFLHLEAGQAAARRVASSTLFLLSFGRDDYVSILSGTNTAAAAGRPKYGRRGLSRLLVSQMIQAVKDLYEAEARRIAVVGVGPLGCAPRAMWERAGEMEEQLCADQTNEMIVGYNERLVAGLLDLEPKLPGARIVFCDAYKGMMEIISNPSTYGFENTRDACCGAGMFGGMIGCLTEDMACRDPGTHVWWDLYAATEAVDSQLAGWCWSPARPEHEICTPITLQQLASAP